MNRLSAVVYPTTALNVHYYYDESDSTTGCSGSYPIGHLTRMVDASGRTTYCYDAHGNVTRKVQRVGSSNYVVRYTWNAADRLMSEVLPDGASIHYVRDADGRILRINAAPVGGINTNVVSHIGYLPLGPASAYTFAQDGQKLTRSFDHDYRQNVASSNALYLRWGHDPDGNPDWLETAAGQTAPAERYVYDPLDRLSRVLNADKSVWQSYTYTKTGDRLRKTTAGVTPVDDYHYDTGTHHLSSITGYDASSRAFDANGNTTALQANGWTYGLGYADTNRLSLVQQNGVDLMSYAINGRGERVRKTPASGTPTDFVYDESGRLLSEYTGAQQRDYLWAGDILIAILDNPSQGGDVIHYVHTDNLGTPRAVTTQSGTTVWTWPYTRNPFGEQPASSVGYTFNLRYPGQYFDAETGLAYNMFRELEFGTGRYLQSDPSGLVAGVDTYSYTNSTPLKEMDRKGLQGAPIEDPIPPDQQSPYPLTFPKQGSSGAVTPSGMPEDQFPHAEEPNIPQYTMVCLEWYCDPDYGKLMCTANGGPQRQPIQGAYPLESTVNSEPGCFCQHSIPEDLVQQ